MQPTADLTLADLFETVKIDQLTVDPANARLHDARNLAAIKHSLTTFGQQKPVVATQDGVIIAGNGTYLAARSLGWPALVVVRTKLKGNSAKAYALADNRTSELARWDYKKLGVSLRGLRKGKIDIEGLGWLDYELAPLLAAFRPPEKGELANKPATPRHLVIIMDDDWGTVERAIGYAREIHGKATSEGKALRIMAGEYIANHKPPRNGRSAPAKAKAKRNGNGKAKRR